MTQRKKLIELIEETENKYIECIRSSVETRIDFGEFFADRLLANGVIVPPCKVGDRLYQIVEMPRHTFVSSFPIIVEPQQIIYINVMGSHSCIPFDDFGKTVFLTREEAEKALAERGRR
jgi:hypothetical protein